MKTMTAKHTPGPWTWDDGSPWIYREINGATVARVAEDNGHMVAEYRKPMPMSANARLIAAAPDLLEACRAALEWLGECHKGTHQAEIADELRAAIAKAGK